MTIVSNTGPLIALAKADQLALLRDLFGDVCIPPVVHRELLAKFGVEGDRLDDALAAFIEVREIQARPPAVAAATDGLDAGERDAVALAHELQLSLLIDDRLGRQAARRLGIPLTGVVGVLISAHDAGRIPSALAILETIRQRGYWLSDALIELVRSRETPPASQP